MKALVTGGGGFLGQRIVEQLVAAGHDVVALQRGSYPALEKIGARVVRGDLTHADDVKAACEGVDAVFHVAAKVGFAGSAEEFERINVGGTQNVLDACRAQGVARLVYCSTPSVTLSMGDDVDVDESAPYAARYLTHYPRTKAEAERRVLAANGTPLDAAPPGDGAAGDGAPPLLKTCALRPHLIFGPGDQNALPRLITRAKQGRLRIIGSGENRVDWTYVDNAARAHVLAEEALRSADAPPAGKAYFITNGEPVNPWSWFNTILEALGLEPIRRRVSLGVARTAGKAFDAVWSGFGLGGEPPITEFTAVQMATTHTYRQDNARRDLGYLPEISLEEGTRRTIDWLRGELAAGRL